MNVSLTKQSWFSAALAWYFVTVWGSGFIATKIGLQYAPPFTFLTLRFLFGLACLVPILIVTRPRFPGSREELGHVVAAGLLMRRGQATRVTSLIYLTPIFAVALELAMFAVVPSALSLAGIAVTCLGVALVAWRASLSARRGNASTS